MFTATFSEFIHDAKISITDIAGRLVFENMFSGNKLIIDASILSSGSYSVVVFNSNKVYHSRFEKIDTN
ncbi:MAG: T9SS type A sorting domain-containing protein [Bacteroidetes bacterium]|nr:T9SS type A sorting domain-containing protein [Bacteroidota bacterium]